MCTCKLHVQSSVSEQKDDYLVQIKLRISDKHNREATTGRICRAVWKFA